MNIVFDFGAVLFTWKPAELLAASFPERACTALAAADLAQAVFGHADWNSFDRGVISMDAVVARIAERLALAPQVLGDLVGRIADELRPMADSVAVLQALHSLRSQRSDLRLYYLSNMPEPYARALEQRHDFLQWFDGGVFSSDVKIIKPDPAIYWHLQQQFDLQPSQTVFIDDLLANVNAAQDQGWHGIQFASAGQLKQRLAALGL